MDTPEKSDAAAKVSPLGTPVKENKQRKMERIPGLLIARFEGLTEDQVRSGIASFNTAITIDMIVLDEGLLLFQVPLEEQEALKQRVRELPCFISCEDATK